MSKSYRAYIIIRNFLFSRTNREFLLFLFFLGLSSIFWLMLTLNEVYEREVKVPVRISDVPTDVMLTSEETDTVRVLIRDRGIILFTYMYGDALKNIKASFRNFDQGSGNGSIAAADVTKMIQQRLTGSSKVVSIKPDELRFYYNTGAHKRVPVRWRGRVIPEHLYFLSNVTYSPDSVTVYASEERLDSIRMVYTEPLNYVGFHDTLVVDTRLRKMEGVKMVPDRVRVNFFTDVLTEEQMDGIPVQGINLPPGKVLRTFPAKVSVRFVTGVNVFRTLKPTDFTVIADYDEIATRPSEKCNIYLQNAPQSISRAALVTRQVDYLLEEVTP
jgi:hypothetical protein